jgi:hypothetical protein
MIMRLMVFGLSLVLALGCDGKGSGHDGAAGAGGTDGASASGGTDGGCHNYCEGNLIHFCYNNADSITKCPASLGSTCMQPSENDIYCTCGSVTAQGVCYSDSDPIAVNAGQAVWAFCVPRTGGSQLRFFVCSQGRTCSDQPACYN